MKKIVELPLLEPMYSAYHNQSPGTAIIIENESIRNWYLNNSMILHCNRMFLRGLTTPELDVKDVSWIYNPHLEKQRYEMKYLKEHIHAVIFNLLDDGYYVFFDGIDDYYVEGKCWYKEKHSYHDGLICGYNDAEKTYCIYAYDSNWVYQKFWTPIESFEAGRRSMFEEGKYGFICGIKPLSDIVQFSAETALNNICEYLDSDKERYPEDVDGPAFGIIVHEYLVQYLGKLLDESIPYNRKDRRIFRVIWEHKKAMWERIVCIEKELNMDSEISDKYKKVVNVSNDIRMLYASYTLRRKDTLLEIIQDKLNLLNDMEKRLLNELIIKTKDIQYTNSIIH